MTPRGAPLRFVATLLGLWVAGRGWWIWADRPLPTATLRLPLRIGQTDAPARAQSAVAAPFAPAPPLTSEPRKPLPTQVAFDRTAAARPAPPSPTSASSLSPAAPLAHAGRLTGSAWLLIRAGHGARLATRGQLGRSQVGMRVDLDIAPRLAATARLSAAFEAPHAPEAALGLTTHALPNLSLTLERRVALGPGARSAFAALVAGGLWKAGLPGGLILDGYGQAGMVGLQRRDPFADGALRLERPLGRSDGPRLGLGVWGAIQPGATRLDIGPQLALPLAFGRQRATLALEGRVRIAGHAQPGSGLALTVGTDF